MKTTIHPTLANSDNSFSTYATPMQAAMVLPVLYNRAPQPYVQQFTWEFREALDYQPFKRAWQLVLKRHDVFNQKYRIVENGTVAATHTDRSQFSFAFTDWKGLPGKTQEQKFNAFKSRDLQQGFDPENQPLCRFNLFQLGKHRFKLVWTSHHCLFDGRSRLILIREFLTTYLALLENKEPLLPAPRSFSVFQNWVEKNTFSQSRSYWKNKLRELEEPTPLAFGMEPIPAKSADKPYAKFTTSLDASLTKRLQSWSNKNKVSLNILIQAAWGLFLHRTSGTDLVAFGAPRACRKSSVPHAEETVGLFVNTVPVALQFKDSDTVETLLSRARRNWTEVRDHENTPIQVIREASGIPSTQPLFKSLIGFEKYQLDHFIKTDDRKNYHFELEGYTDLPLVIQVYDGPEIQLISSYQTELFSEAAIHQTANCLIAVMTQLISERTKSLKSIGLLAPRELQEAKRLSRGPGVALPKETVHRQFEEVARKHPHHCAVSLDNQSISYRQLNEKANQLARHLVRQGVKPGSRIGLFLERDLSLPISVLAVLKTGGAYVPFDPEYPKDRLQWMASDSSPLFILASSNLRNEATETQLKVIFVDEACESINHCSTKNLKIRATQNSPAYVMYTSGSTGKPKGVMVPHRGINRLVIKPSYVTLNSKTRTLLMAPISFDASTFEMWGALLNGGTCVLYPERVPDLAKLNLILRKERINTLWLTASLFNFIIDAAPDTLSSVTQLLVGGEALSKLHIAKARQCLKSTRLINGYGPTENTTFSCCYPIPESADCAANIPIGKPIQNSSAYVLDKYLKILPSGVPGELYVGGLGVALAYLNRKKLSEERFIPDPFVRKSNQRLYKTGDRIYRTRSGELMFLGRFDDQLKIRGHRIEPGEVRSELITHPKVKEACVKAVTNHRGETELAAFLVLHNRRSKDSPSIRNWLADRLPHYLVPRHFIILNSFPLTANGKVNAQALRIPDEGEITTNTEHNEKVNGTEQFLIRQWKSISGVRPASLHTSFFEAGGDSLRITSLLHKVESHFKIRVPFGQVDINQSIYSLAKLIDELASQGKPEPHNKTFEIMPTRVKRINPLSREWRGKYFKFLENPNTKGLIIVRAFLIKGKLQRRKLEQSLNHVISINERVRTRAIKIDGAYFEEILPEASTSLHYQDISNLGLKAATIMAKKAQIEEGIKPMDFSKAPLVRARLLKLAKDHYFFIFSVHHAVADGASIILLLNQISTTYEDLARGDHPTLKPSKFSFRQREDSINTWLAMGNRERLTKFWKQQVAKSFIYHLPFEKSNTPRNLDLALMDDYKLDPVWDRKIQDFCEHQGITQYVFLLTLGSLLVSRYTGNSTAQALSSTAARSTKDEMDIVGEISSVIYIHKKLHKQGSFLENLKLLMTKAYSLLGHAQLGQEQLIDLAPTTKHSPFQTLRQLSIAVNPDTSDALSLPNLSVSPINRTSRRTLYRLALIFRETREGLIFSIHYPPNLYKKNGIERLVYNFQHFIRLIIRNPTLRMDQFPDLRDPQKAVRPITKAETQQAIMTKMPASPIEEGVCGLSENTSFQAEKLIQNSGKSHPDTPVRKFLADTWTTILGNLPPSLDTSFFDSGGDSLAAIHFIYKIRTRFDLDLPFTQFAKHDTIRKLSHWIDAQSKSKGGGGRAYFDIVATKVPRFNPLSYKWRETYYSMITNPVIPGHLICRAYIFEGKLDKDLLKQSINFVANLHERLRTKATQAGDEYFEEIVPAVEVDLIYKDYSGHGERTALRLAKKLFNEVSLGGMNLQKLPLMEPRLLKIAKHRHFFILTIHHSVIDARSLLLILQQISQTYQELSRGLTPGLRKPRFSFRQYYDANEAWLDNGNRKRLENFWKKETRDLYRYQFPFEKKRYSNATARPAKMETFHFKQEWTEKITAFCETHGLSKYVFLLATAQLMIYRYVGNPLVFVSNSIDMRKTPEEDDIVGHLGCIVYIKNRLRATESFIDLTKALTKKVYEIIGNNNLGSPRLGKWIPKDNAPGYTVQDQIFVSKSPEAGELIELPGIRTTSVGRSSRTSGAKLNLVLQEIGNEMVLTIHHQPDIFLKYGIERMFFNLQRFMRMALETPNLSLNQFPDLKDRRLAAKPISKDEKRLLILQPGNPPSKIHRRKSAKEYRRKTDGKPLSKTQTSLVDIWTRVLGGPPTHPDVSFFDSGGHSLLAIQFLYRFRKHFNRDLPFKDFEENDSINKLARWIDRAPVGSLLKKTNHFDISATKVPRLNPLSYRWTDVYFHQLSKPIVAGSLISRAFILEGALHRKTLETSINHVVNLHERLRTKATPVGQEYFEEIFPEVQVSLDFKDISKDGESRALKKAKSIYEESCLGGMNLQQLPLLKTQLFKLGNQKHFFLFTIHHSVADGVSVAILFKQISQTYLEISKDQPPGLRPPLYGFRQYYNAYERWLKGANRKRLENYWKKETRDVYRYQLPFEKKRYSSAQAQYSRMETYRFKDEWKHRIATFCKQNGISKYVFLLTAVQVMLYRYLQRPIVFVNSATDTRKTPEEAEIIGDLSCTVYIKQRVKPSEGFTELANKLKAKVFEVTENNLLGSPRLSRWEPDFEAPGFAAVDHINVMKSPDLGSSIHLPGIQTTPIERGIRTTDTKFNFVLCESDAGLFLELHYPPDILLRNGIERMSFNLQWFMRLALDSPDRSLRQFPDLKSRKAATKPLSAIEQKSTILERFDFSPPRPGNAEAIPSSKNQGGISSAGTPPLTKTQRTLKKIWMKVLKEAPIDRQTSFFDSGGHSILAANFIYEVQKEFNVPLPYHTFKKYNSIGELANYIDENPDQNKRQSSGTSFTLSPVKVKRISPLSNGWKGLYFPFLNNPQAPGKIISRAYILEGKLRRQLLKKALNFVVNSHERLRTGAIKVHGEFFEEIKPRVTIDLPLLDLSGHSEKTALLKAHATYEKEGLTPMDFRAPPLLRAKLLKLSKNKFYFIFSAHHGLIDGTSLKIILDQLSLTYRELAGGDSPSTQPTGFSFRQFEECLNAWLTNENERRIRTFWKKQVGGAHLYHLPFEKKRCPLTMNTSVINDFLLHAEWSQKISQFCETHGLSKYVFFETLVSLLISRYTGKLVAQNACASNLRSDMEQSDIVGNLSAQLFFFLRLKKTQTFLELADRVSKQLFSLLENKFISVANLKALFPSAKANNFEILRQLSVTLAPDTRDAIDFPEVTTTPVSRSKTPTLFRLVFNIRESRKGLIFSIHHPPNLYLKHGIDRMIYHLQDFTRILIENPNIRLNELPDLGNPKEAVRPLNKAEKNKAIMDLVTT